MKMMVKLAVLFATLLLLTGVSFAIECNFNECYEITATEVDNPSHTHTGFVMICLDYDAKAGEAGSPIGSINLSLFFQPLGLKILAYPGGTPSPLGDCVGAFKFHGSDNNVITGIGFCDEDRWTIWGHRTEGCAIYSDETLKKNIEPLSSSLEKVMLLQGVSYDWKVDEYPEKGFTKNRQIGFIAQDVEKVFPELVQTDNNGYKAVYYTQMVPVLLEAMKEQQKEISELKKQQAMMAELTDKIAQLEKALGEKGSKVSSE